MAERENSLRFPVSKLYAYSFIFCAFFVVSSRPQFFENPRIDKEVVLWKKGDNGVAYYRIPIITALPDGTLLALSEARKHSSSDSGPKFLAIRQSGDMGTTWTPTAFIEDDQEAPDGLNLGSITVDDETGTVLVMYSYCFHKCSIHTTYVIRSNNQGKNWTTPQNISNQIGTFAFAPGPGFGIQKTRNPQKGRLITCGHSSGGDEGMYCVVSDDHGVTWKLAGVLHKVKTFDPNECQLVELDDGSILLTARNELHEECHCRIMARSYDGCETFPQSDIYFDKTLIDPTVAAGLVYYKAVLYFSNPANPNARINMTVRWSADQGETWKGVLNIWKAASGYSCLTGIPSPKKTFVGLVFEKGIILSYESIMFVRIEV